MLLDCRFSSKEQKAAFVLECERKFESRIDAVTDELIKRKPKIVALSGPTCSGKTTTARKIISDLTKSGADVHLISIDDFFKERDSSERDEVVRDGRQLDYDSIDALNFDKLKESVESILQGKATVIPSFDFETGKSGIRETIIPGAKSVFLFEGIQTVYPEFTALLGDGESASVHISVNDGIEVCDEYFNPRELRLMRRIVRDYKFRGAKPEFTFFIWASVTANEDKSIIPFADRIELQIDSLLPYEIMAIKGELIPILDLVPEDSRYYVKALELKKKLRNVDTIDLSVIPKDSLLREFVG